MSRGMRNAEGYYDPTASLAIGRVEKEEKMVKVHDGDVITVARAGGGEDYEEVVLRCHTTYFTTYILYDGAQPELDTTVRSRSIKHISAGRLAFARYSAVTGLIRTLTDEEYDTLRRAAADALGLTDLCRNATLVLNDLRQNAAEPEPVKEQEQTDEPDDTTATMLDILYTIRDCVCKPDHSGSAERIARLEGERDVYKSLFEKERRNE